MSDRLFERDGAWAASLSARPSGARRGSLAVIRASIDSTNVVTSSDASKRRWICVRRAGQSAKRVHSTPRMK